MIANMQIAKGDKNEGKNHEYYVTVEYYGKLEASNNINIKNPAYDPHPTVEHPKGNHPKLPKTEHPKLNPKPNKNPTPPTTKPKTGTYKTPITGGAKRKAPDQNGKIVKVEFVDTLGKPLTRMRYGMTVVAKITSRNMKGRPVTLKVWEDDLNDQLVFEKSSILVGDESYIGIVLTQNMHDKGDDLFEGSEQELFLEVDYAGHSVDSSVVTVDPMAVPTQRKNGKSPVVIKQQPAKPTQKGKCPNCDKDITADDLKTIFPNADVTKRTIVAKTYNKYMKQLNMNTCWIKAHFFAQARVESGLALYMKTGESLDYPAERLPVNFAKFRIDTHKPYHPTKNGPNELAYKYGRSKQNNFHANEKMIANIAYGTRLGNKGGDDGWNFRGRGLVQLTGRTNYTNINEYTTKYLGKNILIDFEKVGTDLSLAVFTSMAYLHKGGIVGIGNNTRKEEKISLIVGNDVKDKKGNSINHVPKQKAFDDVTSKVFKIDECKFGKSDEKINAKDIITYHIFSDGRIEKHIPKNIKSEYKNKYKYIYHDINNKEHELGVGDFLTIKNKHGAAYGGDKIDLIDIRQFPSYSKGNIKYKIMTWNTGEGKRYYMNDKTLASFLGALLNCGFEDIVFNGFSNSKGGSGVSKTHFNGFNGDIRYLCKDKSGSNLHLDIEKKTKEGIYGWRDLDKAREITLIENLVLFGWKKFYSWKFNGELLPHSTQLDQHNHHLHMYSYQPNYKEINEK